MKNRKYYMLTLLSVIALFGFAVASPSDAYADAVSYRSKTCKKGTQHYFGDTTIYTVVYETTPDGNTKKKAGSKIDLPKPGATPGKDDAFKCVKIKDEKTGKEYDGYEALKDVEIAYIYSKS